MELYKNMEKIVGIVTEILSCHMNTNGLACHLITMLLN